AVASGSRPPPSAADRPAPLARSFRLVPLDRARQAGREIDGRGVAEDGPGARDVGQRVLHVAGPVGLVDGLDLAAEDVRQARDDVEERDALAAGDVEDLSGRVGRRAREEVRLDGVVDETEVARLMTVAVDGRAAPLERRGDEARDDRRVLRLRVLI